MNSLRARPRGRRQQQGVTLMVALVMLVIIGITSVSVMRGALNSDLVANNTRVQSLASQAAQIALRYCEDMTTDLVGGEPVMNFVLLPQNGENEWEDFSIWHAGDAGEVNEVPDSYIQSADSTFEAAKNPQCMAETIDLGGRPAYRATARGFSPDYDEDDDGNAISGSVVWLQSTFSLN